MEERFEKENFTYGGGYLSYNGAFVARFKYRGMRPTKSQFQKTLIKHYTPAEYFERMANRETPIGIFEADGLMSVDIATGTIILDGKNITRR